MEMSRKQIGKAGAIAGAGIGGAFMLACTACCLPLAAPLLAWMGVAGMTLAGPVGIAAATVSAGGLLWFTFARRRRRQQCKAAGSAQTPCQAGCGNAAPVQQPAPIACNLSNTDFKGRALWLSELKKRALISHRIEASRVHLSYRPEASADVEKMVRQEQECCAFLHFDLQHAATTLELTVTAPAAEAADARALFAHLLPD